MELFKLWEILKDREAWHAAIYGGHKELDLTELLNNNKCWFHRIIWKYFFLFNFWNSLKYKLFLKIQILRGMPHQFLDV